MLLKFIIFLMKEGISKGLNNMIITSIDVKNVFLSVIQRHKSFEEAHDWAAAIIAKDELGEVEVLPIKDVRKVFCGLTYLLGLDLLDPDSGGYFHSIENVIDEFHELFD